jgi:hypothetical protein
MEGPSLCCLADWSVRLLLPKSLGTLAPGYIRDVASRRCHTCTGLLALNQRVVFGLPPMDRSDDEKKILQWLDEPHDGATTLWDSDLMTAFGWDLPHTQDVLTRLRDEGLIEFRSIVFGGRTISLGDIQLTRAGRRAISTARSGWVARLNVFAR